MGEADPQVGPDWERLGRAVQRRREVLGVTQEEVAAAGGPSVATLRTIENAQGESYRSRTLYSLDAALGWQKGTSIAIANGEKFVWFTDIDEMVEEVVRKVTDTDRERYDVLVASSERLSEASSRPSRQQVQVRDELHKLRERLFSRSESSTSVSANAAYERAAELTAHLPLAHLRRLQGVLDATIAQREVQQQEWMMLLSEAVAAQHAAMIRQDELRRAIEESRQNGDSEESAQVAELRARAISAQDAAHVAQAKINDRTSRFSEFFDAPMDDILPGERDQ